MQEEDKERLLEAVVAGDRSRCLEFCTLLRETPSTVSWLATEVGETRVSQALRVCVSVCPGSASCAVEQLVDFAPRAATQLRHFGFVADLPHLACPSDTLACATALVRADGVNAAALTTNGYVRRLGQLVDQLAVSDVQLAARFLAIVVDEWPEAESALSESTRRTVCGTT